MELINFFNNRDYITSDNGIDIHSKEYTQFILDGLNDYCQFDTLHLDWFTHYARVNSATNTTEGMESKHKHLVVRMIYSALNTRYMAAISNRQINLDNLKEFRGDWIHFFFQPDLFEYPVLTKFNKLEAYREKLISASQNHQTKEQNNMSMFIVLMDHLLLNDDLYQSPNGISDMLRTINYWFWEYTAIGYQHFITYYSDEHHDTQVPLLSFNDIKEKLKF